MYSILPFICFMRKENVDCSTEEKYGLSSANLLCFLFAKMCKRFLDLMYIGNKSGRSWQQLALFLLSFSEKCIF